MIITARATPATDAVLAREVSRLLDRRAALEQPPASLTVSDAVALGIAGLSAAGRVPARYSTASSPGE